MFGTKKQIKAISTRLENFIDYHNDMVRKYNKLVKLTEDLDKRVTDLQKRHNGLCECVIDMKNNTTKPAKKPAKKTTKKTTSKKASCKRGLVWHK